MARYKYFLPLISICPPPGYRLTQVPNVHRIGALLDRADATVTLSQTLLLAGRELGGHQDRLIFRGGRCVEQGRNFEVEAPEEDGWDDGKSVAYLETHAVIEGEGNFTSQFMPPFYTIYAGPERKTFFSDNALKYGNTVTIYQIRAFGAWVEGYPASAVDPQCDVDESLVLINPFLRPTVVDVTLEGVDRKRRFRIDPQAARRISIASAFEIGPEGWAGQVYVSGRNRVVMFVAKHSLCEPSRVTTVEHSNPYRGETTHLPMTRLLRRRVGDMVSRALAQR